MPTKLAEQNTAFSTGRLDYLIILWDDQAVFFHSPKGLTVILGCAHAEVVNTMDYVAKLSGDQRIYAVLGGMHLINATAQRIERTIKAFRRYYVQGIGLAYCTGSDAVRQFSAAFAEASFSCCAGTRVVL